MYNTYLQINTKLIISTVHKCYNNVDGIIFFGVLSIFNDLIFHTKIVNNSLLFINYYLQFLKSLSSFFQFSLSFFTVIMKLLI